MSIVITAGQRGDSPQFKPVLEQIRVVGLEKSSLQVTQRIDTR
ncbi:hypothetical protein ACFQ2K_08745 [Streptomyces sanglieri]|uniref:Uncharacterized protein n=1 Tax=Streptomyces sanglieri TaxID=193460 RepID=A0ABW2WQI8_9ACTN